MLYLETRVVRRHFTPGFDGTVVRRHFTPAFYGTVVRRHFTPAFDWICIVTVWI